MLFSFNLGQMPSCTRFGRMVQRNQWNRQGIAQKSVNLLVYIIAGDAVFTIGDDRIPVSSGDVLFIPAHTP
ncbi:MAG: AraC family ligand binding domain-containing protein [Oscillospiraceae bacterium]|nr:AraC family ligand binding domain-containing protein [Oscillospiraceae bacterium]